MSQLSPSVRRGAALSALALAVGLVERWGLTPSRSDLDDVGWQLFLVQRELFVVAGVTGLVILGIAAAARRRRDAVLRRARLLVPAVILGALIFFAVGEITVRAMFWGGIPFSGGGPIVRDFESGFVLNRFDFEGRSRGPEYAGADNLPRGPRVLVQGDSITWGAGIRKEADLYTTRLRGLLQESHRYVHLAAVAHSGREIDGHRRALERYGEELRPDVIIYQWYVNDLEVDGSLRPRRYRLWRRSDIHRVLVRHSYFWFFVDNRLDAFLPGPPASYSDYILETFGRDTAAWERFRSEFVSWAERARALTPHVVVLLYPAADEVRGFWPGAVHERVGDLAARQGLTVVDFIQRCDEWCDDFGAMYASPYDRHPNENVHRRLAEVLRDVVAPLLAADEAEPTAGVEAARTSPPR